MPGRQIGKWGDGHHGRCSSGDNCLGGVEPVLANVAPLQVATGTTPP